MQFDEVEIIYLELKYCERCGGLWLRPRGQQDVHCGLCVLQLSEVARSHSRRRPALRLNPRITVELENGVMVVVCGEGGNA
jgi:hypothetical protein